MISLDSLETAPLKCLPLKNSALTETSSMNKSWTAGIPVPIIKSPDLQKQVNVSTTVTW